MGIRYYAYAYGTVQTDCVEQDPPGIVVDELIADAWEFESDDAVSTLTGEQRLPERDILYLDRAWMHLQRVTAPQNGEPIRPAHRMFQGEPSWAGRPVERTLSPQAVVEISADLALVIDDEVAERVRAQPCFGDPDGEVDYVLDHLARAREFVKELVRSGRGMIYMIG